jgi:hypothetical protein
MKIRRKKDNGETCLVESAGHYNFPASVCGVSVRDTVIRHGDVLSET